MKRLCKLVHAKHSEAVEKAHCHLYHLLLDHDLIDIVVIMASAGSSGNNKMAIARLMADLKEITLNPTEVLIFSNFPLSIKMSYHRHG